MFSSLLPWALVIVGLLGVGLLIYLVVLVMRTGSIYEVEDEARQPEEPAPEQRRPDTPESAEDEPMAVFEDDEAPPERQEARPGETLPSVISPEGLRGSFRRARRRLKQHLPGSAQLQLPWHLVVGANGSHRPESWGEAGLSLPFGPPGHDALALEGCNWWLFDNGILLDPAGDVYLHGAGTASDARGFQSLLRQLEKARPQRPIDGVILTLSCGELLSARRREAQGMAELERRAVVLYQKLWQAQRRLRIRFPVYVLVTDCEALAGWDAFCAEMPEDARGQMLGWSNPYHVETTFREAWIDEAFGQLDQRLDQARLGILAERHYLADADGVFQLPLALRTLRQPLRRFLGQIFKTSAYHETILCRGLYFSGRQAERTLFLSDLLDGKVFPEVALAVPTRAALISSHRTMRGLQIALAALALVLIVGTGLIYLRRGASRDVFRGFLDEISSDIREIRNDPVHSRARVREQMKSLVDGLVRIDTNRFRSPMLPASLFGSFDRDLERALTTAYEEVVFKAMQIDLSQRAQEVIRLDNVSSSGARTLSGRPFASRLGLSARRSRVEPMAAELLEEYRDLDEFLREVAQLEENVAVYNGLADSPERLEELGRVLEYLFDFSLPDDFYRNSQLYEDALDQVEYQRFDASHRAYADFAGRARRKAEVLGERLHRRLFAENSLNHALETLEASLEQLEVPDPDADDGERFRRTLEAATWADEVIAHPDLDWVFLPDAEIRHTLADLASEMQGITALGQGVGHDFEREAQAEQVRFRAALATYASSLTGPLMAIEDGAVRRELSGDVQLLEAALRDFLGQGFMTRSESQVLRAIPAGHNLLWDDRLLEQAKTLYEPYDRFRARTLPLFPIELQTRLEQLGQKRLTARVLDLVARAQRFQPSSPSVTPLLTERQLQGEIEGFAAGADDLHDILGLLERLDQWQPRRALASLIADQGAGLLAEVDELLAKEELYRPAEGDFSWWDGVQPVASAAFDAANADELALYLELQRQRIEHLATAYAQPLITALAAAGIERLRAERSLYARWEAILQALHGFANKKAGNSVVALESFIAEGMAAVAPPLCTPAEDAVAARGRSSDAFADWRRDLLAKLVLQCRILTSEHAQEQYRLLAGQFQDALAGRFPFAAEVPGAFDTVAEAEDLRSFFRRFDAELPYLRTLASYEADPSRRLLAARRFVARMEAVRAFFAAYLDADPPAVDPAFDVDVDFRVNQDFEAGAEKIIGWELEVGEARVTHRSDQRSARWTLAEPLRLTLRWAKDGTRAPVEARPRPGVSVDGYSASFEHADRWALLSLLAARRAAPASFASLSDALPYTLELTVPTLAADELFDRGDDRARRRRRQKPRTAPETPEPAILPELPEEDDLPVTRVFVRLRLRAPDSQDHLAVPTFPADVPRLDP